MPIERVDDIDCPRYLDQATYARLLEVANDAAGADEYDCEPGLHRILQRLGISPPPPEGKEGLCPTLFASEVGRWHQCIRKPGHVTEDESHVSDWAGNPEGLQWFGSHRRSLSLVGTCARALSTGRPCSDHPVQEG